MTVCNSRTRSGSTESPIGFSFPELLSREFNPDVPVVPDKPTSSKVGAGFSF
ncbi:hypothetical protein Tco_0605074, partial [Tanacetum coccineum]